jgi:hypothetical protein
MGATILQHNLATIVTVLTHSHPIAKALFQVIYHQLHCSLSYYKYSIKLFFFFSSSPKTGREKEKQPAD